jgi:hypothetical protein
VKALANHFRDANQGQSLSGWQWSAGLRGTAVNCEGGAGMPLLPRSGRLFDFFGKTEAIHPLRWLART